MHLKNKPILGFYEDPPAHPKAPDPAAKNDLVFKLNLFNMVCNNLFFITIFMFFSTPVSPLLFA